MLFPFLPQKIANDRAQPPLPEERLNNGTMIVVVTAF